MFIKSNSNRAITNFNYLRLQYAVVRNVVWNYCSFKKKHEIKTKYIMTSLVVWWSELLTTNHEVPGSISGSIMGIFLLGGGSPW